MPFLSPILNWFTARQAMTAGNIEAKMGADQAARQHQYAFNRAMLKNRVYRTEAFGGFRDQVFRETFGINCTTDLRLVGAFNPVREIVDAYQNCLRGTFGQELKIADDVAGRPVNDALKGSEKPATEADTSPVSRIWKWSNLDTAKALMAEWAANYGTVGLRCVAVNDPEPDNRRVSVVVEDPSVIYDFDTDDRGNVTDIELRYTVTDGEFGNRDEVGVREVLTKTRFVKELDGRNVLESDQQRNELGVCPYVILRHRDEGDPFGRWAYDGSEDIVHWINLLMVNQGESVMEHAWPRWFAAAGGPKPETFELGRRSVAYVKMDPDTPPPIFQPLVAALDQDGARNYTEQLIEKLYGRQPELILSSIKALAGQSGETIAKLQIAAEAAIKRARAQYEHAVTRILQIGLSEGVRMGLWDLGAGTGDTEAAERSYQQGLEDFAFAERPALPQTTYDRVQQAQADQAEDQAKLATAQKAQAAGFDEQGTLEKAGLSPEEAKAMRRRKRENDVIPTETP